MEHFMDEYCINWCFMAHIQSNIYEIINYIYILLQTNNIHGHCCKFGCFTFVIINIF